jgi:hypothetical protein
MIRTPESSLDLRPIDSAKGKELFATWGSKEDKRLY